ncbi:hypothetical protein RIF29_39203 [Crotalaria pallida]|uniref:Leucine-rich repeat-containing N-terminal plant-type domain-containing protein n=1 Tax=Crotalaria pallida TaxID=3830 RepID=A0AAN9HQG6_CROPI
MDPYIESSTLSNGVNMSFLKPFISHHNPLPLLVEIIMNTSLSPIAITIIFPWILCSSSIILMLNTAGMCSSLEIQCNKKDKDALLSFKKGVIDPSNKLSSWSTQ